MAPNLTSVPPCLVDDAVADGGDRAARLPFIVMAGPDRATSTSWAACSLPGGVGDDETTGRDLLLGLDLLDDDAVLERLDGNRHGLPLSGVVTGDV